MAVAVVVTLLVIGSLIFHFASPWWFTPLASNWGMIDETINITFWVTGIVFVAVNLFLAWCVFKYKYKKGQGETIKAMMLAKHPEANHVATDRYFFNPFAVVRRKKRQGQTPAAT